MKFTGFSAPAIDSRTEPAGLCPRLYLCMPVKVEGDGRTWLFLIRPVQGLRPFCFKGRSLVFARRGWGAMRRDPPGLAASPPSSLCPSRTA